MAPSRAPFFSFIDGVGATCRFVARAAGKPTVVITYPGCVNGRRQSCRSDRSCLRRSDDISLVANLP